MALPARSLPRLAALLAGATFQAFAQAPAEPLVQARAAAALDRLMAMRPSLGLDERHTFRLRTSHGDELGLTHARLEQRYQGLRVWGAEAIAHTGPEGEPLAPTLALRGDIDLNTTPSMEASEALARVHGELAPSGPYAGEPRVELVVYPDVVRAPRPGLRHQDWDRLDATAFTAVVRRYVLAWHVHAEIENPGDIRHVDVLVNAHTGAILDRWESLHTSAATGTGRSQYSGTVALATNTAGSGYELRDTTRAATGFNEVRDMNHATSGTGALYTDADNTWGDGLDYKEDPEPTTSANGQTVAVDAAFGLQSTWDMFRNVLGRHGIDGQGSPVYARVHFDSGYDNAFYSDNCRCLTFGDGTRRLPYTPVDIVGHEFSHGVCSATAGLIYSKESGGLNESNSDIFGVMTEFYVRGANGQGSVLPDAGGNWTQGEQIATAAAPQYRRMYKPSLDGKSADAWSPTLASLDVHYSSGPMNRCFYFMSQGATVTGDTSTAYLPQGMAGIGNQKAAKIWYRALTTYMTPATDYAGARIACIQAVRDLHPLSGPEEVAVWNAFAGINVGGPWAGPDQAPVVTVAESGSKGTLTFSATASDDKGVAKVDFLLNGAVVGTKTAAPYAMTYDSLMEDDGTHTLTARATDTAGLYTNASMAFTIANGQLLRNASFEKGYGVGWSNTTGMQIGAILNTPSYDGTKCAKFCGSGSAMSVRLFQAVSIPSDATAATLSFALRVETKETSTAARDTFAVQVRDASGASVLANLATYSNLDASAAWAIKAFDLSAFRGQTVQVSFLGTEDAAISTGFLLDKVTLIAAGGGAPDTTAPSVSATESGSSGVIALAATASDNVGVTKVEFHLDGALVGTDTTAPYGLSLDSTSLANGSHSLVAKAHDAAGNIGTSAPVAFSISNAAPDTTAPAVSASESGSSGSITFSATATDNVGVAKVEFHVDGVLKGVDTAAPWSLAFDSTSLSNGSHTLIAKAYDAAGNMGTSAGVAFSVSNVVSTTFNEVEGNGSLATANAAGDGVTKIVGYVGNSTDQDFFRINVAPGRTVTVNMTGPALDYDLYLLGSSGSVLKSSAGSTATESVSYTNTTAATATYYLKVLGWSGAYSATAPYSLALVR